ncbi:hypothetical protein HK102_011858, partial [Quaeritorhiza haematococci]
TFFRRLDVVQDIFRAISDAQLKMSRRTRRIASSSVSSAELERISRNTDRFIYDLSNFIALPFKRLTQYRALLERLLFQFTLHMSSPTPYTHNASHTTTDTDHTTHTNIAHLSCILFTRSETFPHKGLNTLLSICAKLRHLINQCNEIRRASEIERFAPPVRSSSRASSITKRSMHRSQGS